MLGGEADALGLSRLLVVASPSLRRTTGIIAGIEAALGGRVAAISDGVEANNPEAAVARAGEIARAEAIDGVVSIGGAAHDLAKAVALTAPSGRGILDLVTRFEPPATLVPADIAVTPLPVLAVPSTFSAAEMLAGGVVSEAASGRKLLFFHPGLAPRRVFLDGKVAAATPLHILAQSGLNAVHHCLEALYCAARCLGEKFSDDRQGALLLARRVEALCETLGAPRRLRDIGLAQEDVPTLAREALADWLASTNPRPLELADLTAALEAAW